MATDQSTKSTRHTKQGHDTDLKVPPLHAVSARTSQVLLGSSCRRVYSIWLLLLPSWATAAAATHPPCAPLPAARRVFSQESWKVWDFFSPPSHCWDLREGRHYFCIMQELFIPTELEVWPEVRCKMSYFKLEAFPSENHPLWKEKNHVLIKKNPKTSTRRNPLIPRYKRPTGEERHLKQ